MYKSRASVLESVCQSEVCCTVGNRGSWAQGLTGQARAGQAEAEYWRRSEGFRTGWSDQLLGFDCGGQQGVLEVAFPTGTLRCAPAAAGPGRQMPRRPGCCVGRCAAGSSGCWRLRSRPAPCGAPGPPPPAGLETPRCASDGEGIAGTGGHAGASSLAARLSVVTAGAGGRVLRRTPCGDAHGQRRGVWRARALRSGALDHRACAPHMVRVRGTP